MGIRHRTSAQGRGLRTTLTIKLKRSYNLDAPKGVRGRNSDNTLIKKVMNWAPSIRLEDGMEKTYKWIYDEMTSGKASVVNALPRAVAAQ